MRGLLTARAGVTRRISRLIQALGVVALSFAAAGPADGQPGDPSGAGQIGGVDIRVETFGLGNVVRPGSWTGIRMALTDHGPGVRDVLVRLVMVDADGDIASMQQRVALAPGAARGLWTYARMPFSIGGDTALEVVVEPIPDGVENPVAGAEDPIGVARIGPSGVLRPEDAVIGVLGRRSLGLEEYAVEYQPGQGSSGTLHNITRTVAGLRPVDLPDSWLGLDQFDALIWADGDPATLLPSQVRAIEDWVRNGGRLIVMLGAGSPDWTDARADPLLGIMPETLVQRLDGADLSPLRDLVTLEPERRMPDDETLHVFKPLDGAEDTIALLNDARGRTVAVRRTVGCGETTLLGIDLGAPTLAGILDAEAFWHRVLGRRGDLFTMSEMDEIRRSSAGGNFFHPDPVWLDQVITVAINKIGRAGVGVLLGLIVFGLYLLLAGPVSFAALGRLGRRQHSWVVFVAISAVFTGIAWGGATALRPAREDITHLTLLEHVYRQPTQRAKTWFSALLPTYGAQTVSIPTDSSMNQSEFAALSNWDDPESFARGDFPDSRVYSVEARKPESLRVPTRSTVKRFEAEWVGGPRWSMIRPETGDPIRIDADGRLHGTLTHGLPAPLSRVTVMLVRGQTPLTSRRLGGPLLADAWAHRLTEPWAPGQPLDLGELGAPSRAEQYLQTLAAKERTNLAGVGGSASPEDRLEMALWQDVIEPPSWREANTGQDFDRPLRVRSAHGWGGGRWFTQPCLLIVGLVDEAPCPVPIEIDGSAPPVSGRTALRWVYPLGSNPPRFESEPATEETN